MDSKTLVRQPVPLEWEELPARGPAANEKPRVEGDAARSWGPFELVDCLGSGGFAEVHRARYVSGPFAGREVALKILLMERCSDTRCVQAMVREADLRRELIHPSVPQFVDAGLIDGRAYVATKFVDGVTLRDILTHLENTGQRLSVEACCFIADRLANALHYVHYRGGSSAAFKNVHGDLSPDNVLLTDRGEVFLIDFGSSDGVEETQGAESAFPGKIHYLTPEHVVGEPLTPASDVFALGALLYELLTNQQAFSGYDCAELFTRIQQGEVIPLSVRRPEAIQVDGVMEQALAPRCSGAAFRPLHQDDICRYSTMLEMSAELRALYTSGELLVRELGDFVAGTQGGEPENTEDVWNPKTLIVRKSSRKLVRWLAECKPVNGDLLVCEALDASQCGIFLRPAAQNYPFLPNDGVLDIVLGLPSGATIEVSGTICWAGSSSRHGCKGWGVEFNSKNEEVARFLRTAS